jgi:hypothetical protein
MHAEIDQGPKALHVRLMIEVLGEERHEMLVKRLQRTFKYPQWERIEMNAHIIAQTRHVEKKRADGERGYFPVVAWD